MRLDVTIESEQLAEFHKRLFDKPFRIEDIQLTVDMAMLLAQKAALDIHSTYVRRELAG